MTTADIEIAFAIRVTGTPDDWTFDVVDFSGPKRFCGVFHEALCNDDWSMQEIGDAMEKAHAERHNDRDCYETHLARDGERA